MRLNRFLTIASTALACLFSSFAHAQCICGPGYDYGCDQTNCGPGATCQQGHCNQDGLDSPSCSGGGCTQLNATNASCEPGNCCPPLEGEECLLKSNSADDECIGAEMRVFSCDERRYVPVKSLRVGDSIRSLSSETGTSVCSDVYYLFQHKSESMSYVIQVVDQDDIVVSPNHLLYTGASFEERRAVLAKNLHVGDLLVSSSVNDDAVVIKSINTKQSKLVNVLSFEPAIELEGGIIISGHSFNESIYAW
eukprot:CAMPEP_0201600446 /NCGR_PEP_ID=MMETSP0492-20130828/1494_1 /ASSEMBLY_ACC=CAM_ASM_000837 /TAXON_ID=420259 /ORGANISM="Thalassiosira gravida, Strain GMp14c1" /LENGTH=250 /DNA_ID=CAMNT_0048063181 /DNA_START=78 /DNA_END=827 /DNA_ORIENTATION=-